MNIYFAVAFDLSRDSCGVVGVGPGTARACLEASLLARDDRQGVFVATAGTAQEKWDSVHMAFYMKQYVTRILPPEKIITGHGLTFNTDGEMRELARIAGDNNAKNIWIIVKWWHAPRSWMLARYYLSKKGVTVCLKLKLHRIDVGWKCILKEFFISIPKTLFRMLKQEVFS